MGEGNVGEGSAGDAGEEEEAQPQHNGLYGHEADGVKLHRLEHEQASPGEEGGRPPATGTVSADAVQPQHAGLNRHVKAGTV